MVNNAPPSQFVESGAVESDQKKEKTDDKKEENTSTTLKVNKQQKSVHFGDQDDVN